MAQPVGTKRGPYQHHQPPRQCAFPGCDVVFTPQNANQHYCSSTHYSTCAICGEKFPVKDLSAVPATCSKSCGYALRRKNRRDNYGDSWKLKCIETNLKNSGVMFPMQSDKVKQKAAQTYMKRFGVSHPMKSSEIVAKLSDTVKSRYGVTWAVDLPQCRHGYSAISKPCKNVLRLLRASGLEYELEYPIDSFRYDIRIKNTNVLLEVNSTATHNSYFSPWGNPKSTDYHRRKTQVALNHGYICFHIWDWTDPVDLLHGLLYSKKFCITDTGQPVLQFYNETTGRYSSQLQSTDMVSDGYFPIYDDGYHIQFIY